MRYRLVSLAATDLAVTVNYYDAQAPGLGSDFLDEFDAAVARICQCPEAWKQVSPRHRRILLRRFPYAVLYHQDAAGIIVSGVMDLRMAPERQRLRLKNATPLDYDVGEN